ncbi:MAG: hypothetical protein EU535_06265 [Promethearchaeota archaeon]|nr:MAG: hypothetical protein EU535_06265 [Candidatus Lokiarchaeota archaeon]
MMENLSIQDKEWAHDWKIINYIFDSIESLKDLFNQLDVSYLREMEQKLLILNLEKYAWSLQNYIIEKYSKP